MYGKGIKEDFILLYKNKKAGSVLIESVVKGGPEEVKVVEKVVVA